MIEIGCWVDELPKAVLAKDYLFRIRELGISNISIMVNKAGSKTWEPRWTIKQLTDLNKVAVQLGMSVTLTSWPRPTTEAIDRIASELPSLMDASGATAFEVDCEGNWKTSEKRGFKTMAEASRYMADAMRIICKPYGALTEMTTFFGHHENSDKADLAPLVDRVFPQAYSVRTRTSGDIAWADRLGPGRIQRATIVGAKAAGAKDIGLGLAAYDQKWPGKKPEEAMEEAYAAAVDGGVQHIRYWSSKWILGPQDNGYASKFIGSKK